MKRIRSIHDMKPGDYIVDIVGGYMRFETIGDHHMPPNTYYVVKGFVRDSTYEYVVLFCPAVSDDVHWHILKPYAELFCKDMRLIRESEV